jgi:hypothetical protein
VVVNAGDVDRSIGGGGGGGDTRPSFTDVTAVVGTFGIDDKAVVVGIETF